MIYRVLCRSLFLLFVLTFTARAYMGLEMNIASIQDQTYRVSYDAKIELPEEIIEAVTSGVPIRMRLDIQSKKKRWYGWDKTFETATVYFDLLYRPLARIYQVRPSGQLPITVRELNIGLENILNSFTYELTWDKDIDIIRSRLEVDLDYLPGPMRLTAWIKPVWRHSSGWIQWQP